MGIFAGCQNQSFYRKMALNVQGVFQNACPEELRGFEHKLSCA